MGKLIVYIQANLRKDSSIKPERPTCDMKSYRIIAAVLLNVVAGANMILSTSFRWFAVGFRWHYSRFPLALLSIPSRSKPCTWEGHEYLPISLWPRFSWFSTAVLLHQSLHISLSLPLASLPHDRIPSRCGPSEGLPADFMENLGYCHSPSKASWNVVLSAGHCGVHTQTTND